MDIFKDYNYESEYSCSRYTRAKHFNKLMYLIINVNKIENGKHILRKYIINNKNEINEVNSRGWTPLMISVRNSKKIGIFEEIKLLIDNGADINAKNDDKWTPLMMAVGYSNIDSSLETVKLLIEKGSDVNSKDDDGWSPLMLASSRSDESSNLETVKLLIDKGSRINEKSNEGNTALLTTAIQISNKDNLDKINLLLDVIKLLIENRADIYTQNNNYRTFFEYIPPKALPEIVKLITQVEFYNFCMKKIIKTIPNIIHILLKPDSLRSRLLSMKWEIGNNMNNGKLYNELIGENNDIFDYLGIYDDESLKTKILDAIKFMD